MDDGIDINIAQIAAGSHGLFARLHLDLLEISEDAVRHRLRTGRWLMVHDGVYRVAGAPRTWSADVLAACWAGGTRACATRATAAQLHTVPGGRRRPIEIVCPHGLRARHDGLVVHESRALPPEDITLVEGIPCTTIERTLFDLAGSSGPRTLELAIDAALRREQTTISALTAACDRLARRGRGGSSRFREAIATRGEKCTLPDSAPERLLAIALVRQGLPEPVLQFVIRDLDGGFVARADLAYPEEHVLVEYDSFEHHTGRLALVRDSARRNAVTALGYRVLTATAADLRDDATVLSGAIRRLRAQSA